MENLYSNKITVLEPNVMVTCGGGGGGACGCGVCCGDVGKCGGACLWCICAITKH